MVDIAEKKKELSESGSSEINPELHKVMQDFKNAYTFNIKNRDESKEDYEYYLGKQFTDEEQSTSVYQGQGRLTEINNIRPYINLLTGYQRQNRNDIIAYPEGDEDSVRAEIATRLTKNSMKLAKGEFRSSDQFYHGCISGESYLYPWMDYSKNIIYGQLKFKLLTNLKVINDPGVNEYDNSDGRFQCIFTQKLSKEQIKTLFPDAEDKIDRITNGQIQVSGFSVGDVEPFTKYYFKNNEPTNDKIGEPVETYAYDLLEYYYKKHRNKYYLINLENNGIQESFDKEEIERIQAETEKFEIPTRLVIQRSAQVWRTVVVGNVVIEDKKAEFADYWSEFPAIPFKAYHCPIDIPKKSDLQNQGIVRSLKVAQREKNVARTHALRHITSSSNSGWIAEEKSLVNKKEVSKSGSKNGALIEYKKGSQPPVKIMPAPLSQGFTFLAEQNTEDFKQISGINADLLSMDKGSDSGRAILLRQRQGLVMIQSLLDNFSQTNEILGRFMVSVLPLLYTPQRALNVLGEAFIEQNFSVQAPPVADPATGLPVPQESQIDQQAALKAVTEVLQDKELMNYNISIGQGINSETVKFNNFLTLNELVKNGYPIPPDVLIDETSIDNATKEKIKNSLARAQESQQQT